MFHITYPFIVYIYLWNDWHVLQQVMERFPASLIQEPTAFMSNDPMEIYNNILVFIVSEERNPNSHSEMHIFQVCTHQTFKHESTQT